MVQEEVSYLGLQDQISNNMIYRYSGGTFSNLVREHKTFVWLVYSDFQLGETDVEVLPTWVDYGGVIFALNQEFPNVRFVESMYHEVIDEIMEMGYDLHTDQYNGGLWDNNNGVQRPLVIGFKKGWKFTDSIGKCYCPATIVEIIMDIDPESFSDYLNQPV